MNGIPDVYLIRLLTLTCRSTFPSGISRDLQSYAFFQLVNFPPDRFWDSLSMFSFFKSVLPCFKEVIATLIFLDCVHKGYHSVST